MKYTILTIFMCRVPVALSKFTVLCNHYLHLFPEHFHPPNRSFDPLNNDFPFVSLPSPRRPLFYFCLYEFAFSKYLMKMESCDVYPFISGLSHLGKCYQDSTMLQHLSKFHSILKLNNIPLCVYIPIFSLSTDTWVFFFIFWLL